MQKFSCVRMYYVLWFDRILKKKHLNFSLDTYSVYLNYFVYLYFIFYNFKRYLILTPKLLYILNSYS